MMKADEASGDVIAQAQKWLVRLRSGDATSEDLQAYQQWRAERPEHAQAASALNDLWGALDGAGTEIDAEVPSVARSWPGKSGRPHALPPGRRAFVGFAVAAGASWFALRPPLQLWPAISDLAADYRTGTGEQRTLALAEGVTVEMNTRTRLNVLPVSAGQGMNHGIDLLAGEAEIVTGNLPNGLAGQRAFFVVAGGGRLQALRARFDVRRVGDQVCVTCVSGSVALEHPQRQVTLQASQQVIYDDRDVRPVSQVDPKATTAWRRGVLVFNRVPLAQVIDEINRYRPGKIILRNPELGKSQVQAQFALARLDGAIDMIGKLYGAHVTKLPGDIVLLS
jgi:transmembrane sensor